MSTREMLENLWYNCAIPRDHWETLTLTLIPLVDQAEDTIAALRVSNAELAKQVSDLSAQVNMPAADPSS